MKICVFSRSIPVHSIGGMEQHCWSVSHGFAQKGHKIKLITTAHPDGIQHQKINSNFEVFYLKETKPGRYSRQWWKKSLELFKELNSIEKFDVVFSESSGAFSYLKYKVKNKLTTPVILRVPGTALRDAVSQLRQRISIRTVLAGLKSFVLFLRDRKWFQWSEAIITCGENVTRAVKKELGLPAGKVYTIYNGINLDKFHPRDSTLTGTGKELLRKYRIESNKIIILTVSRLKKEKGIHILISALNSLVSKYHNLMLIIAGDGRYRKKLEKTAMESGLSNQIMFLGNIANYMLPDYYNIADIFVLPTLAKEGLPWSILEAMACARPVVASDIGGISNVIKNRENGLLSKPGDIKQLASLLSLLLDDSRFRDKIARNACNTIKSSFDEKIMIEKTLEVIEKHANL